MGGILGESAAADEKRHAAIEESHKKSEKSATVTSAAAVASAPSLCRSHSAPAAMMAADPADAPELPPSAADLEAKGPVVQRFYQCEGGQAVFLHPVSAKMLQHERSLGGTVPEELEVTVVAVEHHQVSADLRKRHVCLRHLPLSSAFSFCEVDLNGIVSSDTSEYFAEDLKKRAKQRKAAEQRQRREDQRKSGMPQETYAAEAAACGMAHLIFQEPAPDLEEAASFPELGGGSPLMRSHSAPVVVPGYEELTAAGPDSPPLCSASGSAGSESAMSFAQLTKGGYAAGMKMPALGGSSSTEAPSSPQGVWGSAGGAQVFSGSGMPDVFMAARGRPAAADDDEVPAEFRYSGGPSGLGEFVTRVGSGNGKKEKKKKGRKKKGNDSDDMDMEQMFAL